MRSEVKGVVKSPLSSLDPPAIQSLVKNSRTTSRNPTPMVTTVRIRRGAWAKRRMNRNSTRAPRSTAPTSTIGSDATYGRPWKLTRKRAATAGTAPSWAWAKLMMRLAL